MKFTKLFSSLAVMCSLMAFSPAFATDPPTSANEDLQIQLREVLEIVKDTGNYTATTVNTTANSEKVTINEDIDVQFLVKSNSTTSKTIYITAYAGDGFTLGTTATKALFGTGPANINLVLAKADATQTAVANAAGATPDVDDNVGAIAFAATYTVEGNDVPANATWLAGAKAATTLTNGVLSLAVPNGITTLNIKIPSGDSLANTYSMADTAGDYKCTVYVTNVDPAGT